MIALLEISRLIIAMACIGKGSWLVARGSEFVVFSETL